MDERSVPPEAGRQNEDEPQEAARPEAAYPEVVVDLVGQKEKPVACIAVIRRALQRAGYPAAATRFTDEAFAGATDEIFATARRYLTLVV